MIIAFFGVKQSGKTTSARMLADHMGRAVEFVSFAAPLKALGGEIGVDCFVHKEEPHPQLGFSGRTFMTSAGDAIRSSVRSPEGYSPITLIAKRKIEEAVASGKLVILDDVRYKDEYAMLEAKNALFVRIRRRSVERDLSVCARLLDWVMQRHHSSETELETLEPRHVIANNDDLEALKRKIHLFAHYCKQLRAVASN